MAEEVSDLVALDLFGSKRSRGVVQSTECREELRSHWLGAVRAFLVERGLLHEARDLEPEEEELE